MESPKTTPSIKIAAVGGAAANVLANLPPSEISNAEICAFDTDRVSISMLPFPCKLLGEDDVGGIGTGGDTELGKNAALADIQLLSDFTKGADALIIICGLGGGTASMVAPMLSKLARENGAKFSMAFCIMPLEMEGPQRMELANSAFKYLRKKCDAALRIENSTFSKTSLSEAESAFSDANKRIGSAVLSISSAITRSGLVNADIATLKRIFYDVKKRAILAIGEAEGNDATKTAIENLISSDSLKSCKRLDSAFVAFSCPHNFDMTLMQPALEAIGKRYDLQGKIKFSLRTNESQDSRIEITLLGTCEELPEESVSNNLSFKTVSESNSAKSPIEVSNEVSTAANQTNDTSAESHKKKAPRRFFSFGRVLDEPKAVQPSQGEFTFVEASARGFFSDTPANIRNGEDIDIPSFIRKKLKITP